MSTHPPKKIRAKDAARDIRSGMSRAELMRTYELSPSRLADLAMKLVDAGLLGQDEAEHLLDGNRPPSSRQAAEIGRVQSDRSAVPSPVSEMNAGQAYPVRQASETPPPAGLPLPLDEVSDEEEEDEVPEPRSLDRTGWIMLLSGAGVAFVCLFLSWPGWILGTFRTLVHEMGHTFIGWLFAYPSLPAFDFMWGGGMTFHWDRYPAFLVVIYAGFAGLLFLFRKNRDAVIALLVLIGLHALFAATRMHQVLILAMGHGMELVIGGLFIYRALTGRSVVHEAERPLYAVLGFFLIFSDIGMSFRLLTSYSAREDYLGAKGGDVEMDFSRIAQDHLHVTMNAVVACFLVASVICLVLTFLMFRYEQYVFHFLARLLRRERA